MTLQPEKQNKEQEEVPENKSGPVDPTDSLIPNQDKPVFNPKKETDPITWGNVKPTDAGIGSEKNTNPKNADKGEVKLSDSEIEYVSDANTSSNIESKYIGAQETVELPAIWVEQPDPEKENPERVGNPVTDEVEPPTIPVEQPNPETLDNPVTDKIELPVIPVEQPNPEKENPETMDNPMTDKVKLPANPVEKSDPEKENPERVDTPVTDKVEPPAIPVEQSDLEKENPERVDTPVTDEVELPAIPVEQLDPEKRDEGNTKNPERQNTSGNKTAQKPAITLEKPNEKNDINKKDMVVPSQRRRLQRNMTQTQADSSKDSSDSDDEDDKSYKPSDVSSTSSDEEKKDDEQDNGTKEEEQDTNGKPRQTLTDRLRKRKEKRKKTKPESDNEESKKSDIAAAAPSKSPNKGDDSDSKTDQETIQVEEAPIKVKNKKGMFKIKTYVVKRPKKKRKFKCAQCTQVFDTVGNRMNHKIRDHQLQPRVCNKYGANFFSKLGYDKHILNHNSWFKFKCKECDKGFSHECYLTCHMKKTLIRMKI